LDGLVGRPAGADDDMGAGGEEAAGDSGADAAGAAGDDGHLSGVSHRCYLSN
jgi:hypothetical protein